MLLKIISNILSYSVESTYLGFFSLNSLVFILDFHFFFAVSPCYLSITLLFIWDDLLLFTYLISVFKIDVCRKCTVVAYFISISAIFLYSLSMSCCYWFLILLLRRCIIFTLFTCRSCISEWNHLFLLSKYFLVISLAI